MADIFSGRAIVSRGEGVEGVADAVYVVEQFSDLAAPCLCGGQGVVGDQIEAAGDVALEMDEERVVAGPIVGAKYGDVGKIVAAVGMHSGFEGPVGAQSPIRAEGVLKTGRGVNRVGRTVVRVNNGRWGDAPALRNVGVVDGLKCCGPAVLSEVVVVQTEAAAQDGFAG